MKYTDIYPVFDKLKEEQHVIFNSGANHVTKYDYENLKIRPLIEKINKDIEILLEVTNRAEDKYVHITEENQMVLRDTVPAVDTYQMIVKFQGFKYLFVKSKELYILINYEAEDKLLCPVVAGAFDFLPKGGKCRRTVLDLNKPYARYLVNTYSSFCGFCQIHLNVPKDKVFYKYNKDFHSVLLQLLDQIDFSAKEMDIVVPCTVMGKKVYVRFVKVYNVIIVEEWAIAE